MVGCVITRGPIMYNHQCYLEEFNFRNPLLFITHVLIFQHLEVASWYISVYLHSTPYD